MHTRTEEKHFKNTFTLQLYFSFCNLNRDSEQMFYMGFLELCGRSMSRMMTFFLNLHAKEQLILILQSVSRKKKCHLYKCVQFGTEEQVVMVTLH